ncbi:relaxase/mobilization nuclease domain-containing protein [Uniformispora flossi]|uniref:relaxase/mobilization nuclease domain-containing protein n=1 Tax=Uniformispora flossi TaxID=3390723 RepID=UPI003C2F56F1
MRPQVHQQRNRTIGLLSYLYGPGRRGEHADPHLVASWDGFAPDPGRDPNATLKELADLLDLPVRRAGDKAPSKHVWHMSVRLAPEDRALTETEWGEVARRLMRATGIDPGPDSEEPFCRWVAVRHDDNHIHFAATLARSDGEAYHPFHEGKAAQKEARRIERDLGLRRLDKRDRTAARPPSKAEQFKAERTGRLPRKRLQTLVRTAAAYAADPDDFLTLLGHVGVLARPNRDTNGTIRGCAFALADDRNAAGEPSGSADAPSPPTCPGPTSTPNSRVSEPPNRSPTTTAPAAQAPPPAPIRGGPTWPRPTHGTARPPTSTASPPS